MRVVFVDNLLVEDEGGVRQFNLQPHLGLISLIAVAEGAGHEGALYDPKLAVVQGEIPFDERLYATMARAILRREPDVVGLTALGCNFICTLKVAAYLKAARPSLPILLGGPHASVLHREIMSRFTVFDAIVRNEAELKILPLLDALPAGDLRGVPGVTFRRRGEVTSTDGEPVIADLDALPRPAYERYPIRELGLKTLRVDAGRGCPFKCTFCSTASFFGRKYRLKSPGRLVAELDGLHADYGVTDFALTHDLFTVNRELVVAFCRAVAGRGYTWKCSARIDCVDPELLAEMRAAGCTSIYYGIETGSPRMQRVVEKKMDLALFDPILEETHRVGMVATVSFITGYPQEEAADQDQTLDLVGACIRRDPRRLNVQLHLLTPEPGTRLLSEFSRAMAYDGHITDFNFPTLEADDSAIMESNLDVFMNHHYFLSRVPRRRHVFVTSIYPLLYRLGFPLLGHVLERYEGRLSLLFARMLAWADASGRSPPFDARCLRDFADAAWGTDDYLTSLVHYMTVAAGLRRMTLPGNRALSPRPGAPPRRGARYRLSDGAAVVRDLHPAPAILDILAAAAPGARVEVPEALLLPRGDYLLLVPHESDEVRNFALGEGAADLLSVFSEPRSLRECRATAAGRRVSGLARVIGELVDLGALQLEIPAPERAGGEAPDGEPAAAARRRAAQLLAPASPAPPPAPRRRRLEIHDR